MKLERQTVLFVAMGVALAILAYVSFGGIEKNLVYYWSPSELRAKGPAAYSAAVRLGGLVGDKSVHWDEQTAHLTFVLVDDANDTEGVPVAANGVPPQMFREGIGAVVEGQFDGQTFHASRVMVKHSNEYRPPAAGERPSDLYKTLLPSSAEGGPAAP